MVLQVPFWELVALLRRPRVRLHWGSHEFMKHCYTQLEKGQSASKSLNLARTESMGKSVGEGARFHFGKTRQVADDYLRLSLVLFITDVKQTVKMT